MQVMRDYGQVCAHLRQWDEVKRAREIYLKENFKDRAAWLGLAVAEHLAGDAEAALNVLDSLLKADSQRIMNDEILGSEILLYRAELLRDAKNWQGAIDHIEKVEAKVMDKSNCKLLKAECFLHLQQHAQAEKMSASPPL